jgi:hypothetical protein
MPRQTELVGCIGIIVLFFFLSKHCHSELRTIPPDETSSELTKARSAANFCSSYENTIKLNEDGSILCFDGPIQLGLKMQEIHRLNRHGLFVVRSRGGDFHTATAIADILLEKNATVVIHDYCLSACANYLFVATNKTYVLQDSIVAWHGGASACTNYLDIFGGIRYDAGVCKMLNSREQEFFRKRDLVRFFTSQPPTRYTKEIFEILVSDYNGNKSVFFWMWNPKNHRDFFKKRIIYESYPNSQHEVNEIINRFNLGIHAIYDPEIKGPMRF